MSLKSKLACLVQTAAIVKKTAIASKLVSGFIINWFLNNICSQHELLLSGRFKSLLRTLQSSVK